MSRESSRGMKCMEARLHNSTHPLEFKKSPRTHTWQLQLVFVFQTAAESPDLAELYLPKRC